MLYILFISVVVIFFSTCNSVKLFLSQPTSFDVLSDSLPHPTREGGGVREQLCGSLLPAEAKQQHTVTTTASQQLCMIPDLATTRN